MCQLLFYDSPQAGDSLLFSAGQGHRIDLELIKLFHQSMKLSDINNTIGFFPLLSCGVQSGAAARLFQQKQHLFFDRRIQLTLLDLSFCLRIGQVHTPSGKQLVQKFADGSADVVIPHLKHGKQIILPL